MQDLNAAIQAAKSIGDTSPVLLGGPVCSRTPSELTQVTLGDALCSSKSFSRNCFPDLGQHARSHELPSRTQENRWPCPGGRIIGLS